MSRSYRHTPVMGNAVASSEKGDKRHAHHVERARIRNALAQVSEDDDVVLDERKEAFSNVYDFAKDGKAYSEVRVKHQGRGLKVLSVPRWLKEQGLRGVHKMLGK